MSLTGAIDLQVSNGSLGINGREAGERQSLAQGLFDKPGCSSLLEQWKVDVREIA
jgi:hypothetical protein